MDLLKIFIIISVSIGASVTQEFLYTPPFPSEAIEAANSFLTGMARPIDDDESSNKFNLTVEDLNGSLITPPGEDNGEEKEKLIDGNSTAMFNELPILEDFNDITDDILKRIGTPLDKTYETNEVRKEEESFLESLGRAIGGGGVPGADFPIHYQVPDTSFSCGDGSLVGYYADTDPNAACQVFHICQEDGRHDSFLCPIGTLFNQKYFVCDWWYNVDCNRSAEFYSLNEFLLREYSNKGLRPINFNLKNRTGVFEQIIEEIRNVETDSSLFANKHNTGGSLISNLGSNIKVGNKFGDTNMEKIQSREGKDEGISMLNKDGEEEIGEGIVGNKATEIVEGEEKADKGRKDEGKDKKTDKEEKKEVKGEKKEKDKKSDNELKKKVKADKVEKENSEDERKVEEEKSESETDTTEEDNIPINTSLTQSEQEKTGEDNIDKTEDLVKKGATIIGDKRTSIETTKESDVIPKNTKEETTTANDANLIVLQNGEIQTSELEESNSTTAESKNNKTNGIKKNGSSSTSVNKKDPSKEEVIGYTYTPKDAKTEEILSRRSKSLNSYGVETDSLLNKKGIRN